jgi:hypothetical protein
MLIFAVGTGARKPTAWSSGIVIRQEPETVWPWAHKPGTVKQWVT